MLQLIIKCSKFSQFTLWYLFVIIYSSCLLFLLVSILCVVVIFHSAGHSYFSSSTSWSILCSNTFQFSSSSIVSRWLSVQLVTYHTFLETTVSLFLSQGYWLKHIHVINNYSSHTSSQWMWFVEARWYWMISCRSLLF